LFPTGPRAPFAVALLPDTALVPSRITASTGVSRCATISAQRMTLPSSSLRQSRLRLRANESARSPDKPQIKSGTAAAN